MPTALRDVSILSIYEVSGQHVLLPKRMAHATPDMQAGISAISAALEAMGGHLFLSDLFRSYEMQLQSHLDWKTGKKSAFSPPPGGSLHEAGRALDLDLDSLGMTLADFWPVARQHGLVPIISQPNSQASEAWHFDCRGSHDLVYHYYKQRKGTNFDKPYQAMAASAILSIGVRVDAFGQNQMAAAIQSTLIRLGHEIGNLDGQIGRRTRAGLSQAGVPLADDSTMLAHLEAQLKGKFPGEF
jgi:zinc D-Ala-D-Ala carboxypeptidase